MGYDMYAREKSPELEAIERRLYGLKADEDEFERDAEGQLTPAGQEARSVLVREKFDLQDKEGAYFRASIFGMGLLRDELEAQGLGHWAEPPGFPNYPGDHHFDGSTDVPVTDEGKAYVEALQGVLGFVAEGEQGVALGKFCSNDGWIVTPEECRYVAENADLGLQGDLGGSNRRYWAEFIRFFRKCGKGKGFEVW
jgi:hypothetical protein